MTHKVFTSDKAASHSDCHLRHLQLTVPNNQHNPQPFSHDRLYTVIHVISMSNKLPATSIVTCDKFSLTFSTINVDLCWRDTKLNMLLIHGSVFWDTLEHCR